jgi:hypothetical protein
MNSVHTVPLSAKIFTDKDLQISLKYVNPEVYPGLYDNKVLPKGFKYIKRKLMTPHNILCTTEEAQTLYGKDNFVTQHYAIRMSGRGSEYNKVLACLNNVGFELCHNPISVALAPDGKLWAIDGRTRLQCLKEAGFTNVIVDYYECTEWSSFYTEAVKRNPIARPRSPMKKADIISNCNYSIKKGWITRDYDSIISHVKELTGNALSNNVMQKIIQNVLYGVGYTGEVSAFDEKSANNWLRDNGYRDNVNNNGIYYKVVSASAWSKAIVSVADKLCDELEANGMRVKELRVILHTGTLDGADAIKSWQGKIDSFRSGWKSNVDNIEKAFFDESVRRPIIKLYGAIPAVKEISYLYPMDKLVMFHVGALKTMSFAEIFKQEEEDNSINDDDLEEEMI